MVLKGVSMASQSKRTGIDRIPEKNILYRSPPEARTLKGWVVKVERARADSVHEIESTRTTQARDNGRGSGKRSRKDGR